MTITELVKKMDLTVFTEDVSLDNMVKSGYTGDMLSRVMSQCSSGDCWITILSGINMIAVATLTEAACILLAEGVNPDPVALSRAKTEEIPLLGSEKTSYELCVMLDKLLSGTDS